MKKIVNTMKKSIALFALIAVVTAGSFGMSTNKAQALAAPNWNTTGNYVIDLEYLGSSYNHDVVLAQDGMGNLTGNGGSPAGANVYTWTIVEGVVSGNDIDFRAEYTATADAVTPQTTLRVKGMIASDGTFSGLWSDDYQGQVREGSFTTVSGQATAIPGSTTGTIGGTVTGGANQGTLSVTSIDTVDSSATADGTFENGWKYVFNITLPSNENNLAMKFADWTMTGGAGTLPVAGNMRISSAQANNAGATVLVTAANTYTTPTLTMTTDLDPMMDGIQTKITVEVAVPAGTMNGAYTTSYGVQTN